MNKTLSYQTFTVSSFDELLDNVVRIPIKDQKDLAEDILKKLYEEGWVLYPDYDGSLTASKTEKL